MLFLARSAGQWRPFKETFRATIYSPTSQESLLEERNGRLYLISENLVCFCSDSLYECSQHPRGYIHIPRSCYVHTRSCTIFLPATQEFRIRYSDQVSCKDLSRESWWQSPCSKGLRVSIWATSSITAIIIIMVVAMLLHKLLSSNSTSNKGQHKSAASNRKKTRHRVKSVSSDSENGDYVSSDEEGTGRANRGRVSIIFKLCMPVFLILPLACEAGVIQGTAVYECSRINTTTESCKAYFNAQITIPRVGMTETLILKDESGLETRLDLTILSEESSYNLVHEYYTSSYDKAQGSYVRCRGAWSGCKATPNACTKHDHTDLTLRGTITLPYSWGDSQCFVQSRSGCAMSGHDACHYVAWAVGANCTDEVFSVTTPVFDAAVRVNENVIRLSQSAQIATFRVNLIGSYEGAMCHPPSGRDFILNKDNSYYFVTASSANEGNSGKIGEVQCDVNRKLTRFYAIPDLNRNAQDGKFFLFPQSAYDLYKSWLLMPYEDEICSWEMRSSRLVGFNNIGSPVVLEVVSYGGFQTYRTNIQCEPEITNLWTEGCSNCSQGRKVCIDAKNPWGICSSAITASFPTVQRQTDLDETERVICFPVMDEVSHVKICIAESCIEEDVSWDMEDMIEEQINNSTGLTAARTFLKSYLKWVLLALAILIALAAVAIVIRCFCPIKRKQY